MSEKHNSLGKLSPCWKTILVGKVSVRVGKSTPSLGEWQSSCGEGCTLMWGMHTITWKTLSDGEGTSSLIDAASSHQKGTLPLGN